MKYNKNSLYKDLNKKLNDYFKQYQIKISSTEIFFDLAAEITEGCYHMLYHVDVQINNQKEEVRIALCEFLTDGEKIFDMTYPEIPNEIKKNCYTKQGIEK